MQTLSKEVLNIEFYLYSKYDPDEKVAILPAKTM